MTDKVEIMEAVNAANDALYHLGEADTILSSARKWGIVDIIGGGALISMGKNAKLRQANEEIRKAKTSISRLKKELQDVDQYMEIDFNVDDFVSFADVVFDNPLLDIVVQGRISDARNDVKRAIREIESILDVLEEMYDE